MISRPERSVVRIAAAIAALFALALWLAPAAAAAPESHGHLLRLVEPGLQSNATKSSNWYGYNQGMLEQGGEQFHSISGHWRVPRARQHTRGQYESSSTWLGIGGGCVDARCMIGDSTLIQTGTEQDVSARGKPSYGAWWEIIPGPAIEIPKMKVRAGDHMRAKIAEVVKGSNVWRITLRNITRDKTFRKTVPYTSTYATAEWIQETPLIIGTDAGLASLPKLSRTTFDKARVNGANAHLKPSQRILLSTNGGRVIGTPSAPDARRDRFALCTWAKKCRAPGG
jgi:hypothetical protein